MLQNQDTLILRPPRAEDGSRIWRLVQATGTLDLNSAYLYILLGAHFAETCRLALIQGQLAGFISAYRRPDDPTCLFVWQIGVHPDYQRRGIARRLLDELLSAETCRGVERIETTISPDNSASRGLFQTLANRLGLNIEENKGFPENWFPSEGRHQAEPLLTLAPLTLPIQPTALF